MGCVGVPLPLPFPCGLLLIRFLFCTPFGTTRIRGPGGSSPLSPEGGVRRWSGRGLWFLLVLGGFGGLGGSVVCRLGHPPCARCFWHTANIGQTGAPPLASRKPKAGLVRWVGVGCLLVLGWLSGLWFSAVASVLQRHFGRDLVSPVCLVLLDLFCSLPSSLKRGGQLQGGLVVWCGGWLCWVCCLACGGSLSVRGPPAYMGLVLISGFAPYTTWLCMSLFSLCAAPFPSCSLHEAKCAHR